MRGDNIISNIEINITRDGEPRVFFVDVVISWYSSPGSMYTRNGDPGDPPEFDFDFQISHVSEVMDDGSLEDVSQEFYDELYHEVGEELNQMDIETIKG